MNDDNLKEHQKDVLNGYKSDCEEHGCTPNEITIALVKNDFKELEELRKAVDNVNDFFGGTKGLIDAQKNHIKDLHETINFRAGAIEELRAHKEQVKVSWMRLFATFSSKDLDDHLEEIESVNNAIMGDENAG